MFTRARMATPTKPKDRLCVRGPKARPFIEHTKDSIQPAIASNYICGVISHKYVTDRFEIQQIINRFIAHDRRA